MNAFDALRKKPVSLALRTPVPFGGKLIAGLTGTCEGVMPPGLLIISEVHAASDETGVDVTNEATLAGATVGLRISNIKLLVFP